MTRKEAEAMYQRFRGCWRGTREETVAALQAGAWILSLFKPSDIMPGHYVQVRINGETAK